MININAIAVSKVADMTREEFQASRSSKLGASDVASLMGHGFGTALSVYVNKIEGEEVPDSLQMEVGRELEPFVRRKFLEHIRNTEGVELELQEAYVWAHIKHRYLQATPDDIVWHPGKEKYIGAEYKTASAYMKGKFSDEEVPTGYYIQCQAGMLVTGLDEWYLAYLVGNNIFNVVSIPRNEQVIEEIGNVCVNFWQNHVLAEVPPAPTGEYIDSAALKAIYPGGEGEIELPELEETYDQIKKLAKEKKSIEKEIESLKQQVMDAMENHEVAILGYDGDKPKKASWKMGKDVPVQAHIRKGTRVFRI